VILSQVVRLKLSGANRWYLGGDSMGALCRSRERLPTLSQNR